MKLLKKLAKTHLTWKDFLALTDNIFDLILYAPVDKQAETSTASSDTEKTPLEKVYFVINLISLNFLY